MFNPDYSLIQSALQLGGLCNGEILDNIPLSGGFPAVVGSLGGFPSREAPRGDTHRGGWKGVIEYVSTHRNENYKRSLSTLHISPKLSERKGKVTVWMGGSLIQAKRPYDYLRDEERKASKRGPITGYSKKSQGNLRSLIAKTNRNAHWDFITLTYPKEFTREPAEYKRHLDVLSKRLDYHFPGACFIWKLEPQERGAPHFHILAYGALLDHLRAFIPENWYEIVNSGDPKHLFWHLGLLGNKHCVEPVRSREGVMWYASKYMGKTFKTPEDCRELWHKIGRYWGVFNRKNLPLAPEVEMEVTDQETITLIRYMRKYANLKSRDYKSLKICCNAERWFDNLDNLIKKHESEEVPLSPAQIRYQAYLQRQKHNP